MRLGVLDVGSNTVHLLVVDARAGAAPLPAYSNKTELRLSELLGPDDEISPDGATKLVRLATDAVELAADKGCSALLAFATSAVREAANGEEVLDRVRNEVEIDLRVLTGVDEARLTFFAVRRWFGWSARRLLVFDIGGGSLEMAAGSDEYPEIAISAPLGAGRLTRDRFSSDPPPADEVKAVRRYVRAEIADRAGEVLRLGTADHAVATSKTFRQLARICGAAPASEGPFVKRTLAHDDLQEWLPKLAEMPSKKRADLPGVSPGRAGQLLAGAIVADAAMDLFDIERLEICPWALREGVILRHLDGLAVDETLDE